MSEYNVADIVKNSLEGDAQGVDKAFQSVMIDKLGDALEMKKIEIASGLNDVEDDVDMEDAVLDSEDED